MVSKPLIAFGALVLSVPAFAQQAPALPWIGASIGIYMPSSAELRKDLGNQAIQYGIGLASTGRPSDGSITPSLSLIYAAGNGNSLYIVPYTLGYEYHFGVDSDSTTIPYVRPFAGVAGYDYHITDTSGAHHSVERLGASAGIEAGLLFGKRLKVTAGYYFFTPTSGFSFNGLSLSATYALFTL